MEIVKWSISEIYNLSNSINNNLYTNKNIDFLQEYKEIIYIVKIEFYIECNVLIYSKSYNN